MGLWKHLSCQPQGITFSYLHVSRTNKRILRPPDRASRILVGSFSAAIHKMAYIFPQIFYESS